MNEITSSATRTLLTRHLVEDPFCLCALPLGTLDTPPNRLAVALLGIRRVRDDFTGYLGYLATRSTTATSTRPNYIVAGAIDSDIGPRVPKFERFAGTPAGARVPYGASVNVDDEVAIVLKVELAVVILAVVVSRIAVPHRVRYRNCSVVDDKVAVCLKKEAYAIIETDERCACGFDVEILTCRPLGVSLPFG